jgi:hypothetical protein
MAQYRIAAKPLAHKLHLLLDSTIIRKIKIPSFFPSTKFGYLGG